MKTIQQSHWYGMPQNLFHGIYIIYSNKQRYPDQSAWYYSSTKREIRKNPMLEDFHQFLVSQTSYVDRDEFLTCLQGNVSRQEAVSMIPPLFLDVQPHHFVIKFLSNDERCWICVQLQDLRQHN